MAYNPYQYGGYQPNPYYPGPVPDQLAQLRQNQMQQMIQGPQQPQVQAMQTNSGPIISNGLQGNGIVWVSGKQEADNYFVLANSAVALWDANNPVIYLRKADSTGKPSTVVYDLVERTENPPSQTAPQIDMSHYVTMEQLENILAERLNTPSKPTTQKEDE